METVDITKLSETELKALAYEQVCLLQQAQANLSAIQAELAKRLAQNKPQVKAGGTLV